MTQGQDDSDAPPCLPAGKSIPPPHEQSALEGWSYTIAPNDFENQLQRLIDRGFEFVSLPEYVTRCEEGLLEWGTATITFDDGWLDNYEYAYPIFGSFGIAASIFVVSGEMATVSPQRRMTKAQLSELADSGISIGGHGRSHSNLASLSAQALEFEIKGCKEDLEDMLGRPVDFFAYPGGRFSRMVVEQVRSAGYIAACSSIGGGLNGKGSLFWLYRDVLSPQLDEARDHVFLSKTGRRLFNLRAQNRLKMMFKADVGRR